MCGCVCLHSAHHQKHHLYQHFFLFSSFYLLFSLTFFRFLPLFTSFSPFFFLSLSFLFSPLHFPFIFNPFIATIHTHSSTKDCPFPPQATKPPQAHSQICHSNTTKKRALISFCWFGFSYLLWVRFINCQQELDPSRIMLQTLQSIYLLQDENNWKKTGVSYTQWFFNRPPKNNAYYLFMFLFAIKLTYPGLTDSTKGIVTGIISTKNEDFFFYS